MLRKSEVNTVFPIQTYKHSHCQSPCTLCMEECAKSSCMSQTMSLVASCMPNYIAKNTLKSTGIILALCTQITAKCKT